MANKLLSVAITDLPSDARVLRAARMEMDAGFEVDIVVPKWGQRLTVPKSIVGARVHLVNMQSARGATSVLHHARFMAFLFRYVRNNPRPAVVHVHNMPDYLCYPFLRWQKKGTRIILDVHDIMSEVALHRFSGVTAVLSSRILRSLERDAWRRADRVLTVHDRYRRALIERGVAEHRVGVVRNVATPELFTADRRRPPPKGVTILTFHGSVTFRSGIVQATKAIASLIKEGLNIRFRVFGSGEAAPALKEFISAAGMQGIIEFEDGYLPQELIVDRICDAHLGIVPTQFSRFTLDSIPVKFLEYIQLGIPVIASRLPLISGMLSDGVFWVDEPTILGLKTAVKEAVAAITVDDVQTHGAATESDRLLAEYAEQVAHEQQILREWMRCE